MSRARAELQTTIRRQCTRGVGARRSGMPQAADASLYTETGGQDDEDGSAGGENEQLLQYGIAGVGVLLLLGGIVVAGTREYKLKGVKIAQIAGAASMIGYGAGYVAGRSKGRAEGHAEGMHVQKDMLRRTLGI